MSIDARWFQGLIRDQGKTQRGLAKMLGVDPAQITALFQGTRRMQLPEASIIAQFLGVGVEEVLAHAGLPVSSKGGRRVKVAGWVDEVGEIHLDGPASDVDAPAATPEGTVAVRSRSRDLMAGALIFFRPNAAVDAAAIGRLATVRIASGPWLVRRIEPGVDPGRFDLQWPGTVIENAELSAATPILWIRP
jgi:hypothetical protein